MNEILEKYTNLPITTILLITIAVLILIAFKIFGISSDALLSLISAIIGGLIATSSQAWVSVQNRQNQLRLAAIEKRLQAHQKAYTLWRKLIWSLNDEKKLGDAVLECQAWWENNCLYLDPDSRKAFVQAYLNAVDHPVYLRARDAAGIKQIREIIDNAGKSIVMGVALPTIGEFETKLVEDEKSKKKS